MRIGIDATCWEDRRGFGRFTRELVRQLVDDYGSSHAFVLVADRFTADAGRLPAGARVVVANTRRQPIRAASAHGWRSPLDLFRLGWQAARCQADVFWFPAVSSFYPVPGRVPVVVAFHDATTEERPHLFFPSRRARMFWQAKVRLARAQASAIVAPSEHARQRVAAALRWPAETIALIDEGPAAVFCRSEDPAAASRVLSHHGLPADVPLVLYVGAINPHKNLDTLLLALSDLRASHPGGWHLVIVGEYRADPTLGCHQRIVDLCRALGLDERVTLTGFISDADLAILYNAASLLVLPSLDEGFGLPVIEAMACGLPVAVSARGSLPALVGDAGLTFDPLDRSAMRQAIARLLDDAALRQELGARGLVRATAHSWKRSARQLMTVFEAVAR